MPSSRDLLKIPFKHSEGLSIGIDSFRLEELYTRTLDHDITEPHKIGFYALLYITSGSGKHTVDFHTYHVEPHTLIIISKNQVHQFDANFPLKGYMVVTTEQFIHNALFDLEGDLTRLLFDPISTHAYCLEHAKLTLPHVERLFEEYQQNPDAPEHVPILKREYGLLLLRAERLRKSQLSEKDQKAESSPRLRVFRELLQLHVGDHWNAQQYADELGISNRTLSTLTRKYLNRSPKEVIDQRLLLEIKRLLVHTNISIKEIAHLMGFETPSNLTKFFKRIQGSSPKEFRQHLDRTP